MTPDEIKAAIKDGIITAITLDTSAFGNPSEMNIEYGLLKHMSQFKNSDVDVLMCDVVEQEVKKHLEQGARAAQADLKKILKLVGNAWNKPRAVREQAEQILLCGESPKNHAARRFSEFVDRSACKIIKAADYVRTAEVISRYFGAKPPFSSNESKKYEFPDAYAVLTLQAWAVESDTKVLVVSTDSDWEVFCKDSDQLIYVNDLGVALRAFHALDIVAANRLRAYFDDGRSPELLAEIIRAIQDHIYYLSIDVSAESAFYYDYELQNIEVMDCAFEDPDELFTPIEFAEDLLVAETTATVTFKVEVDFSFTVRDGIDKDYISIGGTSATIEETIELPIVINFGGDIPDSPKVDSVEIVRSRIAFDFGYVEPDYHDD